MSTDRSPEYLVGLLSELVKLPRASQWGVEGDDATLLRIICEALEDGWGNPLDPNQGKKYAKYLPIWA